MEKVADYIPVSVSTIFPDREMGTAFYIQQDSNDDLRLYRGAEYPFTLEDIRKLITDGVSELYIAVEDHHLYQQYLRDCLPEVINDETIPVSQRFESLNLVMRDVLQNVFQRGDVQEAVEQSAELGRQTVDLVCRDDMVTSDLMSILCHDYHTFTHSANVCYYSVMLSNKLGIFDREDLDAIASGALLHDLGKLDVPDSILTKPGRLDEREFNIVKRHPTDGFVKLKDRTDLSFGQMMMVYQHHEWMDGSGYPVGVTADEIHPWANLCAVVDVFEALTSSRPYRGAMSISKALQIMEKESSKHFDESMFQCWKKIITNK